MQTEFVTIDLLALDAVTGGEDTGTGTFGPGAGPNRFSAQGQLTGSGYGFNLSGQGSVQTAKTNYAACLDKAQTPDMIKACAPLATPGQ